MSPRITRRSLLAAGAATAVAPFIDFTAVQASAAPAHAGTIVRLRERKTGLVLYGTGRRLTVVGADDRDRAAHWELVLDRPSSAPPVVRIRNRESGRYVALTDDGIRLVDSADDAFVSRDALGAPAAVFDAAARHAHGRGLANSRGVPSLTASSATASAWTVERVSPTSAPLPRGGEHPWTTYQSQDMTTNGQRLGPSTTQGHLNFPSEASGKRCVRLEGVGAFARFTAIAPGDGMVVRASIPDAAAGGGREGTITLLVNGETVRTIPLTSRHCYTYAYHKTQDQWSDDPAAGELVRFYFDDVRLRLDTPVRPGDTVELRIKDGDMGAQPGDFVVLDFVELEQVPAPKPRPAGFYSITDFGAVPNSGVDSADAIDACIAAVLADGAAGAWIPPGRFTQTRNISVPAIDLRGAGIWYSELHNTLVDNVNARRVASASLTASQTTEEPTRISDLAITGSAWYYKAQNGAIRGRFGHNSVFENLWIEHQQVGMWLAFWPEAGGIDGLAHGLVIRNCRIRNNYADGINLVTTPQDSTVVNCTVRASRDDQFSHWSNPRGEYHSAYNTFKHCRSDVAQRGSGFAIYGGEFVRVTECIVADTIHKTGFMASTDFVGVPFVDLRFEGIDLYRCGGNSHWVNSIEPFGAIAFVTQRSDLADVSVNDVYIEDPTNHGIHFVDHNSAFVTNDVRISNVTIAGATTGYAIRVESSVDQGDGVGATFDNLDIALDTSAGDVSNLSPNFTLQIPPTR